MKTKKSRNKILVPVRNEPMTSDSKSSTLLSEIDLIPIACKTETLDSLYSHALLSLSKSSESKNPVVHEQKFKGP